MGARLRGKHFCKQLAKTKMFCVHQKNAITVASNATCLLKYFVGRQKMWVMWQEGDVGAGGVACQQSSRGALLLLLIVINATKTCVKYASCALLLRFMAHGVAHTHTQLPPLPPPTCQKVQNKFQTVEMLEMSSSFKCVLNICAMPRNMPKMFLIIFKYFFFAFSHASHCRS